MSNTLQAEALKNEIRQACTILQSRSIESQTSWVRLAQKIIKSIDHCQNSLPSMTKELEELSFLLLLRMTTKLDSMRFSEIDATAKEIFERIRDLDFSTTTKEAIIEFLQISEETMTPEVYQRMNTLNQDYAGSEVKLEDQENPGSIGLITEDQYIKEEDGAQERGITSFYVNIKCK